jgi:hypothetical protein
MAVFLPPGQSSRRSYSIYPAAPRDSTQGTLTLGGDVNLNQFGGAEVSGDTDQISFWVLWTLFDYIETIKLQIDRNAGAFTDYYEYQFTKNDLATALGASGVTGNLLNNKSTYLSVQKGDFTTVGTSANTWANARAYRFILSSTDQALLRTTVYLDDLHMIRDRGSLACINGPWSSKHPSINLHLLNFLPSGSSTVTAPCFIICHGLRG